MSLRPPSNYSPSRQESAFDLIGHEILAEKAASLGRTGERAAAALANLRRHGQEPHGRDLLVKDAAAAVHAYFIQREVCGLRRHQDIIRELAIPAEVLVRLGAS